MCNAQAQEALNRDPRDGLQLENIPLGCRPYQEPQSPHSLGLMNIACIHCGAMHFMSEKLKKSPIRSPKFGVCCLQGQIQLPPLPPLPPVLQNLYIGEDNHFRDNIQRYNMAFALIRPRPGHTC